jgi:hypothetical protein
VKSIILRVAMSILDGTRNAKGRSYNFGDVQMNIGPFP